MVPKAFGTLVNANASDLRCWISQIRVICHYKNFQICRSQWAFNFGPQPKSQVIPWFRLKSNLCWWNLHFQCSKSRRGLSETGPTVLSPILVDSHVFPSESSSFTNSSSFKESSSFPLQNHHISKHVQWKNVATSLPRLFPWVLQVTPTSSAKAPVAAEGEDHTRSLARSAPVAMVPPWVKDGAHNWTGHF